MMHRCYVHVLVKYVQNNVPRVQANFVSHQKPLPSTMPLVAMPFGKAKNTANIYYWLKGLIVFPTLGSVDTGDL